MSSLTQRVSTRDDRLARVWYLGKFGVAWFLAMLGFGAIALTWGRDRLVDANMYWSAWQHGLYSANYHLWNAGYSYAPPFAQFLWPLTQLPWPFFGTLWTVAAWAAYAWLLWPLAPRLRLPLVLAFGIWTPDNIYWMLALVAAVGLRFPACWALPLLTKITPGVGIIWFAVRREWWKLGTTLAVVVAVVVVSFCISPAAWFAWRDLLLSVDIAKTGATPFIPIPSLPIRLAVAAALVALGARSDRRWTIPVAMIVAQPDINFPTLGLLAALPRLSGRGGALLPGG